MTSRKTLILMSDTRPPSNDISKFYNLTAYNNYIYAKELGYDFKYVVPELRDEEDLPKEVNCRNIRTGKTRHSSWSKILSVYRELSAYDTVMYIDTDAYVNNMDCLYTRIGYEKIDEPIKFFMDVPWYYKPNAGCFIVDNNEESWRFLRKWYLAEEGDDKYDLEHAWEQNYVQNFSDPAFVSLNINQLKMYHSVDDRIHDRHMINHVTARATEYQYSIIYEDVLRYHGMARFNQVIEKLRDSYEEYDTEDVCRQLLLDNVSYLTNNINYRSQTGQDKYYIEKVSKCKKGGVFLDVGANNGIFESNTYVLETVFDWRGICVESKSSLVEQLKKNRPKSTVVHATVAGTEGEIEPTSTNIDNIALQTKTITEILRETINLPCVIDYVSLAVEGAELEALRGIDFSSIDIKFMTINHSNSFERITEIESLLKAYGYSLHRVDNHTAEFIKNTSVISWDCFDTLVARKGKDPYTVFDIVGEKSGLPDFRDKRIMAEKAAPQTLDSIYEALAVMYEWSDEEKEKIKRCEIDTEVEECFPVVENIQKIKQGDIVVSDMYLSAENIWEILSNCGVKHRPDIYVSCGGKYTGEIWPKLPKIALHTGDNIQADITSANNYGIRTRYYSKAINFSNYEEFLGGDLALLSRLVRLSNPYRKHSDRYILWNEQAQLNIPALILASLELPKDNLAFIHRDCVHLQRIHEAVCGVKNNTFHCSRVTLASSTAEFNDYVKQTALGKCLIDLQGTGVSLTNYWRKVFNASPTMVYLNGPAQNKHTLITADCDVLERFNLSKLGSLLVWPSRESRETNSKHTDAQHGAVETALAHIGRFKFSASLHKFEQLLYLMYRSITPTIVTHYSNHKSKEICTWPSNRVLTEDRALATLWRASAELAKVRHGI